MVCISSCSFYYDRFSRRSYCCGSVCFHILLATSFSHVMGCRRISTEINNELPTQRDRMTHWTGNPTNNHSPILTLSKKATHLSVWPSTTYKATPSTPPNWSTCGYWMKLLPAYTENWTCLTRTRALTWSARPMMESTGPYRLNTMKTRPHHRPGNRYPPLQD